MFWFSPESVLEFCNAATDETNVTNNKKSRARTEIKPFANSMLTLWPEEDWKMCNEAIWHNDTVLLIASCLSILQLANKVVMHVTVARSVVAS